MKTWLISATLTQALEIEVEAKSEKEARKKADRSDLNEWGIVEDLGFEITNIEEQ